MGRYVEMMALMFMKDDRRECTDAPPPWMLLSSRSIVAIVGQDGLYFKAAMKLTSHLFGCRQT
jgi:hypothetical protein